MSKLTPNQKRCEDCACLVVKDGKWLCDECFGQSIEEIDDCPEGVTVELIEQIDSQKIKVDTGARADKPKKESKPRTVVTSDEKKTLFNQIFSNIEQIYGGNAHIEKENKLIIVKIGEKTFKIDLIEQRKPKK